MSVESKIYGRRKGRALRKVQQDRLDNGLPDYRLELPEDGKVDLSFLEGRPLYLEIGFGGGEHLAEQARRHPGTHFIGCEAFVNGVVSLVGHLQESSLTNVQIYPDDVRHVLAKLPDGSLDRCYILCPDPWPKKRQHKRRLIQAEFIAKLAVLMKPGADLIMVTDDDSYAPWIEDVMIEQDYFTGPRGDVYQQPTDWFETRYQKRAARLGNICRYYFFKRKTCRE